MSTTLRVALLAATAGLALTACTTHLHESAPGTNTTTIATTTSATTSAATTSTRTTPSTTTTTKAPTTTTAKHMGRFANKQPYAQVVGYDDSSRLMRFRVLTRHERDGLQDEFDPDPRDSATHALVLAKSVKIDSIGQDSEICPQESTRRCTTTELAAVDGNRDAPVIVQLVIDGDDQVTEVAEQLGAIL
jgi:ABC-type transport system substrate-binding protein